MRIPGSRRSWIILGCVTVVILVITGSLLYWQHWRHHQQYKKMIAPVTADSKEAVVTDRTNQANNPEVQAKLKLAATVKGVTTVADFEKKVSAKDRPQAVLIVLQDLLAAKKYPQALDFVSYTDQKYATVAGTIDFELMAYRVAKGQNNTDLMAVYKQKAEATLRAQKVIGPTDSLDETYLSGETE